MGGTGEMATTVEQAGAAVAEARPSPARRVVLLGNPNVGKSALFNALTGLRATVSNYPGTTVEVYRGRLAAARRRCSTRPEPTRCCR